MPQMTYLDAATGGLMIYYAAATRLMLPVRAAGISGFLGGLQSRKSGEFSWRLAFLLGLAIAGPHITDFAAFGLAMLAGLALAKLYGNLRHAGGPTQTFRGAS